MNFWFPLGLVVAFFFLGFLHSIFMDTNTENEDTNSGEESSGDLDAALELYNSLSEEDKKKFHDNCCGDSSADEDIKKVIPKISKYKGPKEFKALDSDESGK